MLLQPRQQLEAEQAGEGEADRALAVGVDVVPVDAHLGAVAQHALDHGRDFGRGAALELGVDAAGLLLDVPVDHHARPAVADVPFGHQVLIPGAELLRVRGAGRGGFAPDVPCLEDGVGHLGDGVRRCSLVDEASAHVEQVFVALRVSPPLMRLRPVFVPSAYRHSSSRFCSVRRSRCSRAPAVTNCSVKWMRRSTSLSMSSKLVAGRAE